MQYSWLDIIHRLDQCPSTYCSPSPLSFLHPSPPLNRSVQDPTSCGSVHRGITITAILKTKTKAAYRPAPKSPISETTGLRGKEKPLAMLTSPTSHDYRPRTWLSFPICALTIRIHPPICKRCGPIGSGNVKILLGQDYARVGAGMGILLGITDCC